jgi:hypothetical protein
VLEGVLEFVCACLPAIWLGEKLGWVYDVRWPDAARPTAKQTSETRKFGSMAKRTADKPIG